MDLYHSEIRLPDWFVAPTGRVALQWSRHADSARTDDRYGEIPRFKSVTLDRLDIIEIGVEGGEVAKILYRGRYTDDLDVCMVLIPGRWFVKTVWINERNDAHTTLNRSRYVH